MDYVNLFEDFYDFLYSNYKEIKYLVKEYYIDHKYLVHLINNLDEEFHDLNNDPLVKHDNILIVLYDYKIDLVIQDLVVNYTNLDVTFPIEVIFDIWFNDLILYFFNFFKNLSSRISYRFCQY